MSAAADALDLHLARGLRSGSSAGAPEAVRPLVDAALAVRALTPTTLLPRQEFRTELRRRLDAEAVTLAPARAEAAEQRRAARSAETGHRHVGPSRPRRVRRRRPALVAAFVAATIGLGATTSLASASALPGDVLYPFKRQVEDARLALARSDAARGSTELSIAAERLEETQALVDRSRAEDTDELGTVLDDLGSTALSGVTLLLEDWDATGDPGSIAELTSFLAVGIPSMAALEGTLPVALRPVATELLVQWRGVEATVAGVIEVCGDPCADFASTLPAGLVPGTEGGGSTGPLDDDGSSDLDGSDLNGSVPTTSSDAGSVPGVSSGPVPPGAGGSGSGSESESESGPVSRSTSGSTASTGPATGTGAGTGPAAGPLPAGGGVSVGAGPVGAGAPLPSVSVSTGGAVVGVPLPTVTLGGSTVGVPGVTATVPLAPTPTASPTTPRCLISALGICVPHPWTGP